MQYQASPKFMATLAKDMKTLTDNSVAHEAAPMEILYCRIISLNDHYEVWAAYARDKAT
jgi:hypothetical protein